MQRRSFWAGIAFGVLATMAVSHSPLFQSAEADDKEGQQTPMLYELRTYYTPEGKLDALNDRFRMYTMKLFEKHGMKNGMYWTPTDPERSKDTLIYVVSHDSPEAAKKSWDAFRNDPEWIKVRDESEKDGKIVAKVESVYMTLVDYSPVK